VKRYLEFIKESAVEKTILIYNEFDFHKIKDGILNITIKAKYLRSLPEFPESLMYLDCDDCYLQSLPKLPKNLKQLFCSYNKLKSLPELPDGLYFISCHSNNLTSLPELPESLIRMNCTDNPLDYPIPHKFYINQNEIWLEELNTKLSSYEHQKKLINEHGIYIMKKFENHPELINEKIKEENPTYFLSVEYGF